MQKINPQHEAMVHSTIESLIPSVSPSSANTSATEQTFHLCCAVEDEVYPATFARLADEQLIRWMSLDQVALHPRDYPGIDEDITQEEFECREKTLASLTYNEEKMQYTIALPFRNLDLPFNKQGGSIRSSNQMEGKASNKRP